MYYYKHVRSGAEIVVESEIKSSVWEEIKKDKPQPKAQAKAKKATAKKEG